MIPRNLAVTFALLCSLTLGMSLYLWPMAPPADLRAWIALLEREGELVRVAAEVDPYLEITEITDRVVKGGGPALLFENVKGSPHPLTSSAEIRDVYLTDPNTAVIDMNSALPDGQTSGILAEELTLVSVIQTLSLNVPNLAKFKLLVDGKERETLAGHIDLSGVYDVGEVSQLAQQMSAP